MSAARPRATHFGHGSTFPEPKPIGKRPPAVSAAEHRAGGRVVGVGAFLEERPRLLALPDPMPSEKQLVAIDRTALARLDTNLYWCPPLTPGAQTVDLQSNGFNCAS